jgi:type IV secretory pathway VirB10-like protein
MSEIGHNNPPGPIQMGVVTLGALSNWLRENPVIQTEEIAFSAAAMVKRAKASLDEIEAERIKKVKPLNDEVKAINADYKAASELLSKTLDELKKRLTAYTRAEEERRWREAEALRLEAEKAAEAARKAEEREREAKENASVGELGVDVSGAIKEADQKFSEFEKASHAAAVAERDAHIKLSTGHGRAISLRTKETLVVTDWRKAMKAIGLTDKIAEAIVSAARDYRRLKGKLPEGIEAQTERVI